METFDWNELKADLEQQRNNFIKFGTNGYGEPNSRFKFIKYENGDVELQGYDCHSGRINDDLYIPKEDIKKLIELLSK
jgi:hypothetical protein